MKLPVKISTVLEHGWRARLSTYAERMSGGKWKPTRFHRFIADVSQLSVAKGGARIIITSPPRHGKSELCSHWLPTWFLDWFPDKRVIITSYGDALASSFSRKVRDEIQLNERTITKARADSTAVNEWATDKGGGMIAAGVGGPVTGKGGDLIVVDDPHKSWEEALSPTRRQSVIDWFNSTLYTRAEPGASIIIVTTRWHEADLAGHLLKEHPNEWTEIRLPALAEEGDPMGRGVGEPLCPERYTLVDLMAIKEAIPPLMWDALFQQRPTHIGGNIVKTDWWQHWDVLPDKFDLIVQTWDATFKKTEHGSFVVGLLLCVKWPLIYIVDERRGRWDFTHTIDEIRAATVNWTSRSWRADEILVEDKANGSAIISTLAKEIAGIREVQVDGGDKAARMIAETPSISRGQVLLPLESLRPWVTEFKAELERFPAEPNDRGDALSQGLSFIRSKFSDDCGVY